MLQQAEQLSFSDFEGLYNCLIPQNHILRKFNELVDFSFIYDELKGKYCLEDGRNATSPILMFKYLLLKVMYNMSDRDLVERSRYDMSFKYFLGFRPEDDVIHSTSLTKFRKMRLKDENLLDLLIRKSVQIAINKGAIKSKTIIVDSTHTKARYNQKTACEVLLEQAKLLRKTVYHCDSPDRKSSFPKQVESGKIEDILDYCQELLSVISSDETLTEIPAVKEKLNLLRETAKDHAQHLATSKDEDARLGHKTADTSFFGYKTHIAMTDERIVTAAVITSGERSDGEQLPALVEKTRAAGLAVKNVIGDTAYSGKRNIELAKFADAPEKSFQLISKLNPIISNSLNNSERDGFMFNKDAGLFICPEGHLAIRKARTGKKNALTSQCMTYYFDVEKCQHCPHTDGCYKSGAKTKTYSVTINSDMHKEQMKFQETDEFKKLARKRYMIEAKNSEVKHRHGYDIASSSGLNGMEIQGATTLFVTNLKRIILLMG
jgi:transposase